MTTEKNLRRLADRIESAEFKLDELRAARNLAIVEAAGEISQAKIAKAAGVSETFVRGQINAESKTLAA